MARLPLGDRLLARAEPAGELILRCCDVPAKLLDARGVPALFVALLAGVGALIINHAWRLHETVYANST